MGWGSGVGQGTRVEAVDSLWVVAAPISPIAKRSAIVVGIWRGKRTRSVGQRWCVEGQEGAEIEHKEEDNPWERPVSWADMGDGEGGAVEDVRSHTGGGRASDSRFRPQNPPNHGQPHGRGAIPGPQRMWKGGVRRFRCGIPSSRPAAPRWPRRQPAATPPCAHLPRPRISKRNQGTDSSARRQSPEAITNSVFGGNPTTASHRITSNTSGHIKGGGVGVSRAGPGRGWESCG